jgi:hypothetical protein
MFDNETNNVLKKVMRSNLTILKNILKKVGEFGKTNHPFYKRYKHAVLPIMINVGKVFPESHMKDYDTYSIVLLKKHDGDADFRYTIPYSKKVIDGYKLLIDDIECLLRVMIQNRLSCLERAITGVIPEISADGLLNTINEMELVNRSALEFDKRYPRKDV